MEILKYGSIEKHYDIWKIMEILKYGIIVLFYN